MTEENIFDQTLDENPSDTVTRRILSDWLEDQGRSDEANFQRWMVGNGVWPMEYSDYNSPEGVEYWWLLGYKASDSRLLPCFVYYRDVIEAGLYKLFLSRKSAESWLKMKLEEVKILKPLATTRL